MIQTVWSYVAVMLLAAGLFPSLESRFRWRFFSVLPPIVLTYLSVMALAVGLWPATPAVGPRVLAVFACALLSIIIVFLGAQVIGARSGSGLNL
ncbi:MAG: hypothetical protein ACREV5_18610 [Steroidobacter sp.]